MFHMWSSYSLIPFFILETIWNRYPVLDSFPMVLCIRVNRFLINPQTYTISKNTTPVQVDEEIWVRQCDEETWEFIIRVENRSVTQRYRLRASCLHRGKKADFGHYVTVYKEERVKGWVLCNDSKVVEAVDAPISECYLVFYERCDDSCVCFDYLIRFHKSSLFCYWNAWINRFLLTSFRTPLFVNREMVGLYRLVLMVVASERAYWVVSEEEWSSSGLFREEVRLWKMV